jgi:hypothetical protein
MAFQTFCDNKGCRKEMAPAIDKETLKVYCTECGEEINTVSDFMKRQLVSLGQVRRNDKRKLPYAVKCDGCEKEGPPKLDDAGKKLLCSYCDRHLENLSRPFAQMLIETLRARQSIKEKKQQAEAQQKGG